MAQALSEHYGDDLATVSANLYRDGRDSVAWHGDRVGRRRDETVVAILSLGSPRRFLLRPKGGGRSLRLTPAAGDLLVLGGTCQRTWEHSVPKVRGGRSSHQRDVPRGVLTRPPAAVGCARLGGDGRARTLPCARIR